MQALPGYAEEEWQAWTRRRAVQDEAVRRLQAAGRCYQCQDQELGGDLAPGRMS
ncbi:MAG TPA: hypothetical protein VK020_16150 [Microlunatus sp.]|nr:hypothetical protein [Microlunatus sp.]